MSARTPAGVLFWIVAVVSLLWNSIGIADYTMTHLNVEAWLAAYTDEQRAYFDGFPTWYVGTWAIAVWTAFLGSILLLIRSKLALPVFIRNDAGQHGVFSLHQPNAGIARLGSTVWWAHLLNCCFSGVVCSKAS